MLQGSARERPKTLAHRESSNRSANRPRTWITSSDIRVSRPIKKDVQTQTGLAGDDVHGSPAFGQRQ